MEGNELHSLIKEAHEAKLLKQLMAKKLAKYGGIKHDELENICMMFGINKEGGSE